MPRLTSSAAALLTLVSACTSEHSLHAIISDPVERPASLDPAFDFPVDTTVPLELDEPEPSSLPTYPVRDAVDLCLGLSEGGVPIDRALGDQDPLLV